MLGLVEFIARPQGKKEKKTGGGLIMRKRERSKAFVINSVAGPDWSSLAERR